MFQTENYPFSPLCAWISQEQKEIFLLFFLSMILYGCFHFNICMTLEKHGLPWQLSGKEFTGQAGDPGLTLDQEDPLEKEMATPVFLPGKSHGQRGPAGYSP